MPFQKGLSGNINGRKVGAPNFVTQLQREFVQTLLDGQKVKIKRELKRLTGKDYLAAVTRMMEFTIPRLQRTELNVKGSDDPNSPKQVFIIGGKEIEF